MTDHDHPPPHDSSTRSRSASPRRSQSTPPRPGRGNVSSSVSVFGRRGSQSSEVGDDGPSDAGLKNNPNSQSLGDRNVDRSRQAVDKATSTPEHWNDDRSRQAVDKATSTSEHWAVDKATSTSERKLRNIFSADILWIAIIFLTHVLACLACGIFLQKIGHTTSGGQNGSGGQNNLQIHQQPQTAPPFYGSSWPNSSSSSQRKPGLSSVAVVFPLQEFRNTKWEYLAFTEKIEDTPNPFSHSGLSDLATICPFPWTTKKDKTEESRIWIWMNIDGGGGGDKFRKSAIEVLKEIFVLAQQDSQQECQWEVMRILEFFEGLELEFD